MPPSSPPSAENPESKESGSDRRREQRAPIELKVEYKRINSFFADFTKNISKGGTFIATSKPLPIGTVFLFKLTVPGLEAPLQLNGKVAWLVTAEAATTEQPAGMGIRFQYRDDAERAAVHDEVEKLMALSLGPFLSRKLLSESEENGHESGEK